MLYPLSSANNEHEKALRINVHGESTGIIRYILCTTYMNTMPIIHRLQNI